MTVDEVLGALIADPATAADLSNDRAAFGAAHGLTDGELHAVERVAADLTYAREATLRKRAGRVETRFPATVAAVKALAGGAGRLLAALAAHPPVRDGDPDDHVLLGLVGTLDAPWLADLANYENARRHAARRPAYDPTGPVRLSAGATLRRYGYDVVALRAAPATRPEPEVTHLLVYRSRDDRVRTLRVPAAAYDLLAAGDVPASLVPAGLELGFLEGGAA